MGSGERRSVIGFDCDGSGDSSRAFAPRAARDLIMSSIGSGEAKMYVSSEFALVVEDDALSRAGEEKLSGRGVAIRVLSSVKTCSIESSGFSGCSYSPPSVSLGSVRAGDGLTPASGA